MPMVSQPPSFSLGETAVAVDRQVTVEEEPGKLIVVPRGVNIDELVKALNSIGVSPRDLIAIFQAIKAAGARVDEACKKILTNPIIEGYEITLHTE